MKNALWVGPLTLFVMAGTFFAGGAHGGLTGWEWFSVLLAGVACLALWWVRSSPELALLIIGLTVGGYFACGFQDGPIYLPVFAGAFAVGRLLPVRRWLPWLGAAMACVLVGMGIRAVTTELGWWQPTGQAIGVTAVASAAAAFGSLLRSRQQTERERVARVATEEQLRMAQDLHDGVGHGLAVIAMQAGVALHVMEQDPASARRSLEAIREASRESLDSLRAELSSLSGNAPRTPRPGLADLEVLVSRVRAAGLAIDVRRSGSADLSSVVDSAAYAIVQESLTNVLRHADAGRVVVRIDLSDPVEVWVSDDGRGGPVEREGMGLRGMRERVAGLGGVLRAGPLAAGGFEVHAELPR